MTPHLSVSEAVITDILSCFISSKKRRRQRGMTSTNTLLLASSFVTIVDKNKLTLLVKHFPSISCWCSVV